MDSYERMIALLKPLKLYQLDGDGLIEAEMYSYGQVLSKLEERIKNLGKDCFPDELDSQGSTQWERLFGFPQTFFPMDDSMREARKDKINRIKLRLELGENDFHLEGVKQYLESIGITASISENNADNSITVTILEDKGYFSETDRDRLIGDIFSAGKKITVGN